MQWRASGGGLCGDRFRVGAGAGRGRVAVAWTVVRVGSPFWTSLQQAVRRRNGRFTDIEASPSCVPSETFNAPEPTRLPCPNVRSHGRRGPCACRARLCAPVAPKVDPPATERTVALVGDAAPTTPVDEARRLVHLLERASASDGQLSGMEARSRPWRRRWRLCSASRMRRSCRPARWPISWPCACFAARTAMRWSSMTAICIWTRTMLRKCSAGSIWCRCRPATRCPITTRSSRPSTAPNTATIR